MGCEKSEGPIVVRNPGPMSTWQQGRGQRPGEWEQRSSTCPPPKRRGNKAKGSCLAEALAQPTTGRATNHRRTNDEEDGGGR
jgi:hypothetical protein